MVCRLNSCLYGMKQSPRYFFGYLTKKLEAQGLIHSKSNPCLFIEKGIILITYVDDLLIYAQTQQETDDLILNLLTNKCKICKEGTAEGYLGLQVTRDGKKTTLSQPGLTKRIVDVLGLLSKYSTSLSTPVEKAPLA